MRAGAWGGDQNWVNAKQYRLSNEKILANPSEKGKKDQLLGMLRATGKMIDYKMGSISSSQCRAVCGVDCMPSTVLSVLHTVFHLILKMVL